LQPDDVFRRSEQDLGCFTQHGRYGRAIRRFAPTRPIQYAQSFIHVGSSRNRQSFYVFRKARALSITTTGVQLRGQQEIHDVFVPCELDCIADHGAFLLPTLVRHDHDKFAALQKFNDNQDVFNSPSLRKPMAEDQRVKLATALAKRK